MDSIFNISAFTEKCEILARFLYVVLVAIFGFLLAPLLDAKKD